MPELRCTPLLEHWFCTIQLSWVLLFQGGVCGLAVLNRPARCLCSGVMCLSWPGDFLLPEALKVITVEEDLSSAATPFWSSPQHFALLTLPEITVRTATAALSSHWKVNHIFLLFIKVKFNVFWGYSHRDSYVNGLNPLSSTFYIIDTSTVCISDVIMHWMWHLECNRLQVYWFTLIPLKWFSVLAQAPFCSAKQLGLKRHSWITCALELAGTCSCLALWFI